MSPAELQLAELLLQQLIESKHVGTHQGSPHRDQRADFHFQDRGHSKYQAARRQRTSRSRRDFLQAKSGFAEDLRLLCRKFWDGKLESREFQSRAEEALESHYRLAFRHGARTGPYQSDLVPDMDRADEEWVRSAFEHERKFFRGLLSAILKGQSKTETYRRIDAYAQASTAIFDGGRILQLPTLALVTWSLEPGITRQGPCKGCQQLARWSPFPKDLLPTTPKAGLTPCLHNCYCALKIKLAKPSEVEAARRRLPKLDSMIAIMNRIKRTR